MFENLAEGHILYQHCLLNFCIGKTHAHKQQPLDNPFERTEQMYCLVLGASPSHCKN